MPTVLHIHGFRFIIWPSDHEPPHVHVFRGDGEAKIILGSEERAPVLLMVYGMTKREARQAWELTAEGHSFRGMEANS